MSALTRAATRRGPHGPATERSMTAMTAAYPAQLEVDGPVPQNRLTVFFRILLAIPIAIFAFVIGFVAAIMTLIAWFAIVITGKYPAGMLDFVSKSVMLGTRWQGYLYLLTDKYPAFSLDDSAYPVRPTVIGQIEGRNRLTVFFRLIMVIPHIIVLYFLQIAIRVVGIIAWFAALFTGSVPAGIHGFLEGGLRWQHRVGAYMFLLTDEYPPFSLT